MGHFSMITVVIKWYTFILSNILKITRIGESVVRRPKFLIPQGYLCGGEMIEPPSEKT